jgi:succinyl-diaminopimelate desuccinylase
MSAVVLDPAALAAALIRRPSVTPKDEGALDVAAAALEQLGFTCHRLIFGDVHNLYARLGSGRPNLCFAGHTDVVPPGAPEAWSFNPFAATQHDGELFGRGGQRYTQGARLALGTRRGDRRLSRRRADQRTASRRHDQDRPAR